MRPRVWCLGLARTGTSSLSAALTQLGWQVIHHPHLFEVIGRDIESASNDSIAVLYPFLDRKFPGSRFILTERPMASWIHSMSRWLPRQVDLFREEAGALLLDALGRNNTDAVRLGLHAFVERAFEGDTAQRLAEQGLHFDFLLTFYFTMMHLYGTLDFEPEKLVAGHERHLHAVREYFRNRPGDLLVMRIAEGEGWERLCPFLGVPTPEVPFPHDGAWQGV